MRFLFFIVFTACYLTAEAVENIDVAKENLKRIVENAQRDWPDDYHMQTLVVKRQIVAMKEMELIKNNLTKEAK